VENDIISKNNTISIPSYQQDSSLKIHRGSTKTHTRPPELFSKFRLSFQAYKSIL